MKVIRHYHERMQKEFVLRSVVKEHLDKEASILSDWNRFLLLYVDAVMK
jgi:hypothetical protein